VVWLAVRLAEQQVVVGVPGADEKPLVSLASPQRDHAPHRDECVSHRCAAGRNDLAGALGFLPSERVRLRSKGLYFLIRDDQCLRVYHGGPLLGGSMDRESAQNWLNRYIDAWLSYDPDEVAALFSENVVYRYHPYDEPIVGREAVVASWLGEGASEDASTRDVSGTYEAEYSPVAIDGDAAVATGTSRYREVPGGPVVRTYENCFVMRFDGEGRCRDFTEYYIRRP
jgi:ketosteroid isomerase-like protein